MKKTLAFIAVTFALLILGACQTTQTIESAGDWEGARQAHPINVQEQYINVNRLVPQAIDISSGNLFDNSGFESGLESWTGCSAGAIKTSGDAYEGSGALEIIPDNCFYRSAEVSAGDDLILSCYAKVLGGSGWTGMGLGFADSSWTTIDVDVPATVITGSEYVRYDVKFTAPANTKYASMWLFSENPVVVDNCSLMLEAEPPPPPPPPSGDNLIENGDFETLLSDKPTEWSIGCGGFANSVTGRSGKGLSLTGGVCVDQGLSASDISAISGNNYTYSCYAKNTSGYASISIFLDDQPTFKQIPVSSSYQLVEISGTAPSASNGFVSIYSEGSLVVDDCSVQKENTDVQPADNENILLNNSFNNFSNGDVIPDSWIIGCQGSAQPVDNARTLKGITLRDGACIDQSLNQSQLSKLAGKKFALTCQIRFNQFQNTRYTSLSLVLNQTIFKTALRQLVNGTYNIVVVKDIAPEDITSGYVSIYSEQDVTVDDCQLTPFNSSINEVVNFPNDALANAVRLWTGVSSNSTSEESITKYDLLGLTNLECSRCSNLASIGPIQVGTGFIDTLEGLQHAPYLSKINLEGNHINDISALAGLTNLSSINFAANDISDISTLQTLPSLVEVDISDNFITSIQDLSNLENLVRLNLSRNQITSLAGLENLQNLSDLNFCDNNSLIPLSLAPLSMLQNIEQLSLCSNSGITNIEAIDNLLSLKFLTIVASDLENISSIATLQNLERLNLRDNKISDISALRNLNTLESLILSENQIVDISPLSGLTTLDELRLSSNRISDISALNGLNVLSNLALFDNQVESINSLANKFGLRFLNLDHNKLDLTQGSQTQQILQSLLSNQVNIQSSNQFLSVFDLPIPISTSVEYRELQRALGLSSNEALTRNKLLTLRKFEYSGLNRSPSEKLSSQSLIGLATNIEELRIPHNELRNLSVEGFKNLSILDASNNKLSYIPPFPRSSNTKMELLNVSNNTIRFIRPAAKTTNLGLNSVIDLRSNQIDTPLNFYNQLYADIFADKGVNFLY